MTLNIVLTSGDPNGIGLEIAQRAAQEIAKDVPFFILADQNHVFDRCDGQSINVITHPSAVTCDGRLNVLHHPFAHKATLEGADVKHAPDIIAVIERAVALVQSGQAGAVCTNPINKAVLKDSADFAHAGHTEFLAALAGEPHSVMMLACPELRVVPVTIHIALEQVAKTLTSDLIYQTIKTTHSALQRDFGLETPRIWVAGLNPHAGENGTFGTQEVNTITPALVKLRDFGIDVSGPYSADTMFHHDARQNYDVAICMYHDQALIPIKTLDFYSGVNVTLGLPFIRTSPDHGTAYDLVGTGRANPASLIAALRMAWQMVQRRNG